MADRTRHAVAFSHAIGMTLERGAGVWGETNLLITGIKRRRLSPMSLFAFRSLFRSTITAIADYGKRFGLIGRNPWS